jgi:E3 ubiquitin-protein ligase DOA10
MCRWLTTLRKADKNSNIWKEEKNKERIQEEDKKDYILEMPSIIGFRILDLLCLIWKSVPILGVKISK